MNKNLQKTLKQLKRNKFRGNIKLSRKLQNYCKQKGLQNLEKHANELLQNKLFVAFPLKDGKQTPYKGHPVFVAQHATGTCCRSCLYKWHGVPKGIPVDERMQKYIIHLILMWIYNQVKS